MLNNPSRYMCYFTDASEDRLRRLIERTASRLEKRLEEITGHVQHVDDHVSHVDKGERDIQDLQREEMQRTNIVRSFCFSFVNCIFFYFTLLK